MNAKLIRNGLFFSILSAIQIFIGVEQAFAKPELKSLDINIADMGSAYYQFKIKEFQSIDQQRKYRVWLAIPKHLSTLNTSTQYSVQSTQGVASLFMLADQRIIKKIEQATAEQLKNQKLWIMEGDIDFDTREKSVRMPIKT